MVRLAQWWNLRYALVDGQGNFGSLDGDPAAAYRYTEARMTKVAEQILEDIGKGTVDFKPNFDESTEEPVVLPSAVPNLLINGATGIAVGMAANIPPHNLTEIVDACLRLGYTTITIATLGFLGLGLPPPDPDWGQMIAEAVPVGVFAAHAMIVPALAVSSLVLVPPIDWG